MIKTDFQGKYPSCVISARPEYKFWYAVQRCVVFCVDCVFWKARAPGDRCDEFVFLDLNRKLTGIYLVERKDTATGSINVKEIHDQLQGGADFIEEFLSADSSLDYYRSVFLPVMVSPSKQIRESMRSQLVRKKIRMRGVEKRITYVKAGTKLPKL